jgi:hypothetical protein
MNYRDQWNSIEDWAKAHSMTLDDALEEGISQNNDDTIDIPESYPYRPLFGPETFYDTIDVEMYFYGEPKDITEAVNYITDKDSETRQRWYGETSFMEYDDEVTKFMLGKQAYFCYLDFIKSRETDFGMELTNKFPNIEILIIASDIDKNYWAESRFHNNSCVSQTEFSYEEKAPDIYREHLEEVANS